MSLARSEQDALGFKEETMITFTRRSLALLPAIAPLLSPEFARALEIKR